MSKKENNDENNLTTDDLFRLADLYFYKRNYMFRHLYDSYNKFLEEDVKNFLERSDHIFNEKITVEGTVYRRKFRFKNIRVIGPKLENGIEPMFPSDARHRSATYSVKIIADVAQFQEKIDIMTGKRTENITGIEEVDVPIATIPLMVRSKYCSLNQYKDIDKNECEYDPGGYFIVNGSEKVIICQDRMVENKPLVFLKKDSGTMSYIVQVNSRSYRSNGGSQVLNVKIRKDGLMTIRVPILNEVNVFVLFRALGVHSDKDIINLIVTNEDDNDLVDIIRITLDACVNELHEKIQTEEDAYGFLINKLKVIRKYTETNKTTKVEQKKLHLKSLLHTSFIPHIEGSLMEKAYYLGYMINKLLKVYMGRANVDDRDSYINKRVDLPGDLLMELFKQRFKIMMIDCNKYFSRNDNDEKPTNIINQIKPNTIEQGMKASLATGAWIRKKGVAQMLQRYTYLQSLAFLRRVDTPSGDASTSKLTSPRQLHASSVGFLCVIETPEHAKVGVTKHLSLVGSLTIFSEDQYNILRDYITKNTQNILSVTIDKLRTMQKVFLNGEWLGVIDDPIKFTEKLQNLGEIDKQHTSIVPVFAENEIRVYCDSGRFYRPTLKVTDNVVNLKKSHIDEISLNKLNKNKITDWEDFTNAYPEVIEYIDSEYQPYVLIAPKITDVQKAREQMIKSIKSTKNISSSITTNRYNTMFFENKTHMEIHPALLLGEINTNVPFANRNPGSRNIFQYSQGRQAMGIYATNYRDRTDISYILYHPQKPLVTTRSAKYVGSEILPSGENAMVAIATYTGYNQEDSLIMNRDSIHRGMFRSKSIKRYQTSPQKNQSTAEDEMFMKPDITKVVGMRHGSYDKLNDRGFVPEETQIVNGDIIIGKVTPINNPEDPTKKYKDSSEVYKSHAPGVIDKVYTGIFNQDGYETRKVVVRSERIPMAADKYCCYDPEHEVLTTDGWVGIADITTSHKVACLMDGKRLEYHNPKQVMAYDFDGEMYVVNSNQVDLKVTPNHRMYVSKCDSKEYGIELAEDILNKQRQYKKNCDEIKINDNEYDGMILSTFKGKYPHRVLPINPWLTFFGIWITEGYVNNCGYICFAANKPRVKEALDRVCAEMNLKLHKCTNKEIDNDLHKWYVIDLQIGRTIQKYSVGAINKYLPKWVWQLNREQCKLLLDGMVLGDGHTMKNGTKRYDTSSKRLAGDFQRLCLHAGYSANDVVRDKVGHTVVGKDDTEYISRADAHRLTVIETQNFPLVNKDKKKNIFDKMEKYNGKVYCCEVPGEGVIYVRRNGIAVWCGQSRYGQKGTGGLILQAIDMPHNKHGVRPDIILNPNAIPSRQTIGQLLETVIGKASALECLEGDGTAFEDLDMSKIEKMLEKHGFDPNGYEELYNGMTGEKIKAKIFFGPTYYQRLKHMVQDKLHSRPRGPRTLLTRQPPEGRVRDGGLRLGEMERDALIAHGIAKFLHEKTMYDSDAYATYICDICGLFAQRAARKGIRKEPSASDVYYCPYCNNSNYISKIMIPYAFKLLMQELMAMNIAPRIRTKKIEF